jgi:hypothetical protein
MSDVPCGASMDSERIYFEIKNLVETMPNLNGTITPEVMMWLGRAQAIIRRSARETEAARFETSADVLLGANSAYGSSTAVSYINSILFRALGNAEMGAPLGAQGTYIPAGNSFDALAAVGKIFATAKSSLLIVDPYADDKLLREFAPLAAESTLFRILSDDHGVKPSFAPAVSRWQRQYQQTRRLEARLSPARQLHDRLIIVDEREVWIVTQSFNALAERAPASLSKFAADSAQLKLDSYRLMWDAATPI